MGLALLRPRAAGSRRCRSSAFLGGATVSQVPGTICAPRAVHQGPTLCTISAVTLSRACQSAGVWRCLPAAPFARSRLAI